MKSRQDPNEIYFMVNGAKVKGNPRKVLSKILSTRYDLKLWSKYSLHKFYVESIEAVLEYLDEKMEEAESPSQKAVITRQRNILRKMLKKRVPRILVPGGDLDLVKAVIFCILEGEGLAVNRKFRR